MAVHYAPENSADTRPKIPVDSSKSPQGHIDPEIKISENHHVAVGRGDKNANGTLVLLGAGEPYKSCV